MDALKSVGADFDLTIKNDSDTGLQLWVSMYPVLGPLSPGGPFLASRVLFHGEGL